VPRFSEVPEPKWQDGDFLVQIHDTGVNLFDSKFIAIDEADVAM
jgi:NADPH:quinone reductase-like Zn-dependent oxidoreductase